MNDQPTSLNREITLFVGIDWADQKHDCHVVDRSGKARSMQLQQSPEAIDRWIAVMTELAGGGQIAIMLEQSEGPLINALMFRQNVLLYPVNPKQLAKYRESYSASGGKDDPTDARYLARMLRERITILKPWQPDDEQTRLLDRLCEQRRSAVGNQTKLRQQLINVLKQYFPLLLTLFGKPHQQELLVSMLRRWNDPRLFRRADRKLIVRVLLENGIKNEDQQKRITDQIRSARLLCCDDAIITPLAMTAKRLAEQLRINAESIKQFELKISETFQSHPDAQLFSSLRGAGAALAPRLLCAFGSDRDRWDDADQLASFSGIAPITRQSGKTRSVSRRYACPKYLR